MTRGKFISIEGIEGAGKSTQVEKLVLSMINAGIAVSRTREPGGSPNSERLRDLFLTRDWDGVAESFLLMAGRRDHVVNRILPALSLGNWVVSDRFSLTTLAYQGHGRGVDVGLLQTMDKTATGHDPGRGFGLMTDLTIVLDLPVVTGLERVRTRSTPDRMERLDVDFFERVREGFIREAGKRGGQCAVIAATGTQDEVHTSIIGVVNRQLGTRLKAVM